MMQVFSLSFVLACSGSLHFSPQEIPTQQMEKGDFFLEAVPRGQPIEQAEVKMLFHIESFQ
ncbi:MAG: hypothetical protein WCF19_02490 [Chlamydiales bacterium]